MFGLLKDLKNYNLDQMYIVNDRDPDKYNYQYLYRSF